MSDVYLGVNGGIKSTIYGYTVELMGHTWHNPNYDIIACYEQDDKDCNVFNEITYYESLDKKDTGCEVYKFKKSDLSMHYWSRNFKGSMIMATKYRTTGYKLRELFRTVDFNTLYKDGVNNVNTGVTIVLNSVKIENSVFYFSGEIKGKETKAALEYLVSDNQGIELYDITETSGKFKYADILDFMTVVRFCDCIAVTPSSKVLAYIKEKGGVEMFNKMMRELNKVIQERKAKKRRGE